MVQVSSLSAFTPATVVSWMRQVCRGRDLILQDIASLTGTLQTAYLDVIAPYLPGGANACFRRVFVGTVDLPWIGPGSKYHEGIQDPSFQQLNISLSTSVGRAFVARYPTIQVNWYLTYEANLNDFYYPSIEQAYKSMFSAEMTALAGIRPNSAFSWSPAFWFPYSVYSTNTVGMTQLRAMLIQFLTSLPSGGIQLLNLQDYVAGSSCQPSSNQVTPSDAVSWVRFLQAFGIVRAVVMNAEQYSVVCSTGGIVVGNWQSVLSREARYVSDGLTLGPAFEIRYWILIHGSV